MKKILILTHGEYANGILNSLVMISGQQPNVTTICIRDEDTPDFITNEISNYFDTTSIEDIKIIITDIPGGSSTRVALPFACNDKNIYLITGLNLALLLEIVLNPSEEHIEEQIKNAIENAKDSIMYLNDMVNSMKNTK
ncbi:MAG: hypothetical protein RR945_03660 [Erysipelotrichaceae bacterium]